MMRRIALALISLFSLFPAVALAAPTSGINLVTSPLPVNLVTTPGSTMTTELRIKNGGTQTERLKVNLMKFGAYGEEGKPTLSDREAGDDYFDWVSFSPSSFDAAPGEWKTVKMTVKLPASAAFGYYYAPVFSRASVDRPADGKTNALVGSTAILVLVEAKVPNARRELRLSNFTADRGFYEFLPADFTVKLHNAGNIHLVPRGDIFISQGGHTIATIPVNPGSGNILPQTNRIFTTAWADGFPLFTDKTVNGKAVQKDGKTVRDLKWDIGQVTKLRFGRYTATLALAYDNGTRDVPLEATLTFWVIPWRIIGVALLVIVFMAIGLYATFGKVFRRTLKRGRVQK
jgi:hypothetical protein